MFLLETKMISHIYFRDKTNVKNLSEIKIDIKNIF